MVLEYLRIAYLLSRSDSLPAVGIACTDPSEHKMSSVECFTFSKRWIELVSSFCDVKSAAALGTVCSLLASVCSPGPLVKITVEAVEQARQFVTAGEAQPGERKGQGYFHLILTGFSALKQPIRKARARQEEIDALRAANQKRRETMKIDSEVLQLLSKGPCERVHHLEIGVGDKEVTSDELASFFSKCRPERVTIRCTPQGTGCHTECGLYSEALRKAPVLCPSHLIVRVEQGEWAFAKAATAMLSRGLQDLKVQFEAEVLRCRYYEDMYPWDKFVADEVVWTPIWEAARFPFLCVAEVRDTDYLEEYKYLEFLADWLCPRAPGLEELRHLEILPRRLRNPENAKESDVEKEKEAAQKIVAGCPGLKCIRLNQSGGDSSFILFLSSLPKLTELEYVSHNNVNISGAGVRCESLRTLKLGAMHSIKDMKHLMAILRACPNLEVLEGHYLSGILPAGTTPTAEALEAAGKEVNALLPDLKEAKLSTSSEVDLKNRIFLEVDKPPAGRPTRVTRPASGAAGKRGSKSPSSESKPASPSTAAKPSASQPSEAVPP
uniref:Uncharacterized protein n=1 Tax=Chromera velia CCMP2878 TaxID=1169474 RepID=A0A0G4HP57_9ALVE|eukprot:Cvel_7750.t1-p1 / transcript=Cvel_7750.t1 / gene=Cvel_7750 / organism=Chromera_velia_CCMP2878 / gene_product=hypothetical protein / transcript_product=hypothetical protein / location=Cvel_scaffold412:75098-76906(+) / protein_length=551 / sequence_SO=supercontig / SO=protein_coding / is_pseudo=false